MPGSLHGCSQTGLLEEIPKNTKAPHLYGATAEQMSDWQLTLTEKIKTRLLGMMQVMSAV